jgi:hypothetical protein
LTGALLGRFLAQTNFDAFVTVDRNLFYQQRLLSFSMAVVILRARTSGALLKATP